MVSKSLIIEEFKSLITKLKNDISLMSDKKEINSINFKIRNYHKVIKSLESFTCENDTEITDSGIFKDLDGIGKGTLTRIDMIIKNGILDEGHVEISTKDKETTKRIDDLLSITGIGPVRAGELNNEGITLEMLLNDYMNHKEDGEFMKKLTHHQIIGLKYYHQFIKRIPREVITKIDKKIQKLLKKYMDIKGIKDLDIDAIICGSYRRGCSSSGDIDLLVSGDEKFDLIDFVKFLTEDGMITDHLTEKGTTKFMGVCEDGYRLDIRFIPRESFGAALMYFTGSKEFNTMVRTEALKQGYTLEEYGLYPLIIEKEQEEEIIKNKPNKNGKERLVSRKKMINSHQHMKGEKIHCPTEETILEILKIDKKYIDPTTRNI
jgi:DNA polymerase/3'-5' exonuclease PolX